MLGARQPLGSHPVYLEDAMAIAHSGELGALVVEVAGEEREHIGAVRRCFGVLASVFATIFAGHWM
jgi:hypothetical protein